MVYGSRNWVPTFIYGVTPAYLGVQDWTIAEGDPFTERDVMNGNKVCVLGQTLVRELFQGESPLGKEIRIKNVSFRVVGVLGNKGRQYDGHGPGRHRHGAVDHHQVPRDGFRPRQRQPERQQRRFRLGKHPEQPVPRRSAHPLPGEIGDTGGRTTPCRSVSPISIILWSSARSTDEIPAAIRQITAVLRERHRIRPGQPDDFSIRDMTEMSKALSSTTTLMTNLLLCVAMISLVVGGVGIMNIMLVSVTERTREIGLRMSVGARARDILRQFLVEAVVLCLLGGALGILLGHGGSQLVRLLLHWPVETSPAAIAAAVLVSAGVGIVFGFYPAWKASGLDPIEALRYE